MTGDSRKSSGRSAGRAGGAAQELFGAARVHAFQRFNFQRFFFSVDRRNVAALCAAAPINCTIAERNCTANVSSSLSLNF